MDTMTMGSTFKHAKFGRGAVHLESRNGPLDLDQIARAVPSVLAEHKHDSRSDRYTFISTMDIMRGLEEEGFRPFSIMQGGSKDEGKRAFTKHLIRFRNDAMRTVGGAIYEVCLLNSHDGTTSEKMFGGFFKFACKNGLIFFDGNAVEVSIPHKGNVLNDVIEGAFTVVEQGQNACEHVQELQRIELSRPEQLAFARAAAELRFDDPNLIQPERLLLPRRQDDQGSDLWRTFNRIQESTIQGGVAYTQTNPETNRVTHRHSRPVRSVDGDVKLNRALWKLAEEMAKLKA